MTWTEAELLPIAGDQTKRQALVADHFPSSPPAGFEGDYKGQASESGFTVVTVTSAGGFISEITSTGTTAKKVIELQWNGVSSTSSRPFGHNVSGLTANGSVDWGYDRPTSEIIVRPAAGYSPILTSTYSGSVFYFSGVNKINFKDCVFDACGIRFTKTSTYPCLAMIALENCTFQNITTATWSIELNDVRVCHTDACKFTNTRKDFTGAPNYLRSWNNEFKQHNDGDIHGIRGYTKGYMNAWWGNIWIAGCINYDTGGSNLASGDHGDFLQISLTTETGQHLGYSCLVECNISHANRPTGATEMQGIFGDDGSGYAGNHLVHNNIIAGAATWQCQIWDWMDDQDKVVTKNMFLRSATPLSFDVAPTLKGFKGTGPLNGGTLRTEDNYAGAFNLGGVSGGTQVNNVTADPRSSAVSPNRYSDIFTGTFGTDASGWLNYTSPDVSAANASTAKTAILAHFLPLSGWAVDAGPKDPAQWPTGDWSSLTGGGGAPPAPDSFNGTINVMVL